MSKSARALKKYIKTPFPKGRLLSSLNHEEKEFSFHRPPRQLSILFGRITYGRKVDDEEALQG
jgi:hypothetical protein